ncbi:MAG: PD40 domain-containing protein [Chloroflexi bacterium]|nr:PD40 domain-containing protein [Chloroflexota bacterium]
MLFANRTLLGLAGLLGIVAVACSSPASTAVLEAGQQLETDIGGEVGQVDRIAYVSPNGNLFTVDPDGGDIAQLTGGLQAGENSPGLGSQGGVQAQPLRLNEYYTWPTWSADGTKIAASRVVVGEDGTEITVQVMDARTGRSETVYENSHPGLVADGAPHYIYWAPTGDELSFLASTPDGLSLFVWDGTPGKAAAVIDEGGPLYYQWSKDGGAMVLHIGPEMVWARPPTGGASRQSIRPAGNFRVPAISPDGASLAYVDQVDGVMGLYVAPTSDLDQARKIIDVGSPSAFIWSPDGTQIAVADQSTVGAPIYDRLMLVPAEGGPVTTLSSGRSSDDVWAFFWAPTGDKLAWVSVNAAEQELEWVVSPSDGSGAKRLFSFRPSAEVFIMLSFFDQYAYSHSPWSPDGKFLVVAGSKGEAARRSNGRTPTGDRIYVLDAEGSAEPRDLGAGVLAVWSWN